jgi:integrase
LVEVIFDSIQIASMQSHRSSKRQQQRKKKSNWRKVGKRITGLFQYVPSGTFYAWVSRRGKLYRESLQTKDLAFAKRKLAEFKRRLERTEPRFGRITLVRWLEENYLPTLRGAAKTLLNKRCIIERVKRTWVAAGNQPMRDLKPSEIERWLNEEFGGGTGAFYNLALMVIRAALAMAVHDRVIMENPAASIKARKRERPIRLTPTFEQFKAIVAHVRSQKQSGHDADESADFLEACGLLGLGQAEVSGIQRAHVDLEAEQITIFRRKTRTAFTVPIFPQARFLIEKLCAGKKPTVHLFKIAQARAALANACRRLEYPQFSHRSLRRMFITRCIEKGVDVKVIAQWQGHKDQGALILQTYSHVRPIHSQRMAALMIDEQPQNVISLPSAEHQS